MPASSDLQALLRKVKPDRATASIPLRPKTELLHVSQVAATRRTKVLLDTNIYIEDLAGRLPMAATELLDNATLHHCSVCLGEIATGLAARDVTAPGWRAEIRAWSQQMASMLPSRIHSPDRDTWIEAGLVCGTLARVQGYSKIDQRKALNDALVYLTARKAGIPVMTTNRHDFDRLEQLAPGGSVIHVF